MFFQEITVEIDRAGVGWRKGKKKGELPPSNPRIVKFTLDPRFVAYIEQSGIELPEGLKCAADYSARRSSFQGSPSLSTRWWSAWEFLEAVHASLFAAVESSLLPTSRTAVLHSGLYNSTVSPSSIEIGLTPLLEFSYSQLYSN